MRYGRDDGGGGGMMVGMIDVDSRNYIAVTKYKPVCVSDDE